MISKDKTYRTRDGREVRIYATNGHPDEPVHGAIKDYFGKWLHTAWFEDGKSIYYNERCGPRFTGADLVEVNPRIKREYWMNVYPYGHDNLYMDKRTADISANKDRIACVKS